MGEELRALYVADQQDRREGKYGPEIAGRDQARLQRARELVVSGELEDAEDRFCAAMIFQHGSSLDDYWTAHELSKAAAEMGHEHARWLAAASFDRWLMHQGKPQRYGTQFISMGGGPRQLWEVDSATTDEERAAWGVPALADAMARVDGLVQPATSTFRPVPPAE
jgi:hypothetical protein